MTERYTPEGIRESIDLEIDVWFGSYSANRPETWTCSQGVKDCVCIASWMRAELTWLGLNDADVKTMGARFNRESRSSIDLFTIAAEIMNDALDGNIPQDRKPHRRWG